MNNRLAECNKTLLDLKLFLAFGSVKLETSRIKSCTSAQCFIIGNYQWVSGSVLSGQTKSL